MTNTDTRDARKTISQARALQEAGCEIVRIAIPDMSAVETIGKMKEELDIPVVADIHFDYRLAIASITAGCDKIRINPGNIGSEERVAEVIEAAAAGNIPIRIGVNSGSLERELLQKYGEPSAAALAESALNHAKFFESQGFGNIVISVKSSDLEKTVNANKILAKETAYPLHLGLTEAGDALSGTAKSAAALAILLAEGIGDTIRISLTGDPVTEIAVAYDLLRSLKIRNVGIEYISCPTCGRTEVDVEGTLNEIRKRLSDISVPLKIAIMGCSVNGPGEAREADAGIAGGKGEYLVFARGEILRKVKEDEAVDALEEIVRKIAKEKSV
jgi:(E)-4-hydroxy-3-methylbut-2-enyl-diphosphate synthase